MSPNTTPHHTIPHRTTPHHTTTYHTTPHHIINALAWPSLYHHHRSAIALIIIGVYVCKKLQLAFGPDVAAIWISLTNIVIPMYLRHLVLEVEDHVSINSQQLSLFFKLSFFKW